MHKLIKDKRIKGAAALTLLHPDFHKRNIYVSAEDPTVITGLINWQSTSFETFIYTNETPDFAAHPERSEEDNFDNGQDEQKPPS